MYLMYKYNKGILILALFYTIFMDLSAAHTLHNIESITTQAEVQLNIFHPYTGKPLHTKFVWFYFVEEYSSNAMKYLAYQKYITAVYNCAASESNKYEF
jgi:hypothetical protein